MKNALKFASIALGLCLPAVTAHAQFQVVVGQGLVDNKGNPVAQTFKPAPGKPNVIELNDVEIMARGGVQFLVQGQVTQMVTGHPDPPGIDLRFTRLTIINQSTVANPVTATSSIIVQSDVFKTPIGPPFNGRLHLDGYYRSTGHGAPITNSQVSLSGSLLQPAPAQNIGTLTIPAVKAQNGPVYFGPFHPGDNTATFVGPNPDVTKAFPIGGTQTSITLNFTVGQNDRLVLYGSAFSAAYSADRVFTVNSTLDLPDGFPGDGLCDTGTPTSGPTGICTLRAALTEADFQPVVTAIQFNIPGTGIPKIQMQSDTTFNFGSMGALQTVVIDGTTQPGGLVEVDGSQASPVDAGGSPIVGLDLVGQGSMVLGLLIHSFPSHAIQIRPTGAPFGGSNVVEENAIGTDITGLALPNGGDGVHITQQPNNLVLDNVIANNAGQGVLVDGSAATGNTIHATPIFANGGGISLTHSGNNLQAAPVLTSASEDGANLTIGGTLHSAASQTFDLDFFVNSVCDVSGAGQGTTYLGSTSASTDASGDATFTTVLPANPSEGLIATATATDTSGNTSQFSACEAVQQVPPTTQPPVANAGSTQTVTVGTLVMLNGSGSFDPNTPPLPLTFQWTQTSGPAVTLTGANTATPSFTPTQTGTYVFSLVVNNGVLNSAAASVTITVTASALQLIESLIAEVQSLGLPKGPEQSLVSKLRAAENALDRGQTQAAINQFGRVHPRSRSAKRREDFWESG